MQSGARDGDLLLVLKLMQYPCRYMLCNSGPREADSDSFRSEATSAQAQGSEHKVMFVATNPSAPKGVGLCKFENWSLSHSRGQD